MFVNSVLAESNSLYVGDLVFYIVTFIILMLLIKHFAWKPVTDMMKKRADKIASDIDNAAKSRENAEKMAAKRQAELQNSHKKLLTLLIMPRSLVKLNVLKLLKLHKMTLKHLSNAHKKMLSKLVVMR